MTLVHILQPITTPTMIPATLSAHKRAAPHQVWLNIPKWSSKLMIELRQSQLNDISSGQKIQPGVGRYDLEENEP